MGGANLQQYLTAQHIQISFKDIEAVARANGAELFSGGGLVLPQTIDTLIQLFDRLGGKITAFGDTLSDQRNQLDLGLKLYGDPNASAQQQSLAKLNDELTLLNSLAPRLGAGFQGLDVNTVAGRASVLDGLRHLFDAIGNRLTAEQLGKLQGIDELTSIIGGADDALIALAKSAADASGSITNLPNAFKRDLDALRFAAIAVGLPPATAIPAAVPVPYTAPARSGRTDPTGGSVVAPIIVQRVEITSAATNGRELLADLNTEIRREALAAGGSNHPAVRGLVSALGQIR